MAAKKPPIRNDLVRFRVHLPMAYRFDPGKDLGEELRRIASEQIQKALDEMDDDPREAAHSVRKRMKKVRGLLRIVRPGLGAQYGAANNRFRDIARLLAPLRDATSLVEGLHALEQEAGETFPRILDGLERRRKQIEGDALEKDPISAVREELKKGLRSVEKWELSADATEPAGLKRSYRRGRKAMRNACRQPSPEAFHEWRKRVKYHRYHCSLIGRVWDGPLEARRKEAHRLTDLLGEHHDLAELHQLLLSQAVSFGGREAVRNVLERAGERRAALEVDAFRLGWKLYAEAPKRLDRRLSKYWRVASAA